ESTVGLQSVEVLLECGLPAVVRLHEGCGRGAGVVLTDGCHCRFCAVAVGREFLNRAVKQLDEFVELREVVSIRRHERAHIVSAITAPDSLSSVRYSPAAVRN